MLETILASAGAAAVMAILRALADGSERRFLRLFLEGCICAGLGATGSLIALAFDWPWQLVLAIGPLVGFMGTAYAYIIFRTLIQRKLQIEDIKQKGYTTITTGKEYEKAAFKTFERPQPPDGIRCEPRGESRGCKDD